MNIAMVIGTMNWTGAEQHVLYLSQGLIELGHEVHIICRKQSEMAKHAIGKFSVTELPLRSALDWKSIWNLAALIKELKIDVVHTHHNKVGWIAVFAQKLARCGIVVNTQHMIPFKKKNNLSHKWYYKQLAATICPSEYVRSMLLEFRDTVNVENIFVVPLGIDTKKFAATDVKARGYYGYSKDDIVVGYAGRVSFAKGTANLCKAVGILRNKRVKLFVAGVEEGNHFIAINEILDEYAMRDQTQFIGQTEEMVRFYSAIDVFVMPSYIPESFGQAPCEAMAAGKAVILSNRGALPDLIQDGIQGFIVPAEQPEILSEKLRLLVEDADLLSGMGIAAKKWASAKFDILDMAIRTVAAYNSAL